MHELSIAESIVRVASNHADGRRVTKVYVKVGHLRQVVPSALTFSFELVAQGTPAEGAELALEEVPVTALCKSCVEESRLVAFPLLCNSCGSADLRIVEGEELLVESLEMEEESSINPGAYS